MVFHYPTSENREALLKGMSGVGAFFAGKPGFIDAGAWIDEAVPERVVGLSHWESRESFFATGLTFGEADEAVAGETRPRERFLLDLHD